MNNVRKTIFDELQKMYTYGFDYVYINNKNSKDIKLKGGETTDLDNIWYRPKGEFSIMLERFSMTIDPEDYEEGQFGPTDEYFDEIQTVRKEMQKEAEELRKKFEKFNVKVTTSKWNDGCEFGMALYVWIP